MSEKHFYASLKEVESVDFMKDLNRFTHLDEIDDNGQLVCKKNINVLEKSWKTTTS